MGRTYVEYHFRDNNGGSSQLRLHHPFDAVAPAEAFALAGAAHLSGVSDAALTEVRLYWRATIPDPGPAAPTSDCRRGGVLFYRNGNDIASITVPSVALVLTDTSGVYQGVRISRERLQLLGMLTKIQALVSGALDPLGRPYGPVFSVGGRYPL